MWLCWPWQQKACGSSLAQTVESALCQQPAGSAASCWPWTGSRAPRIFSETETGSFRPSQLLVLARLRPAVSEQRKVTCAGRGQPFHQEDEGKGSPPPWRAGQREQRRAYCRVEQEQAAGAPQTPPGTSAERSEDQGGEGGGPTVCVQLAQP